MCITEENFNNIVDNLNQIPQYMPLYGVERATALFEKLGHPEKNIKVIHVAGTNGKGSVCAFINQILLEHGYHTGLFTSPHLVDVRERIRLDNSMISKDDFCRLYQRVKSAAEELKKKEIGVAYFDYFLGIAFCYYEEKNVDFMVMETGLGGRLDATNAVPHPILSVITTISKEHTAILGDTLDKIAFEKAGIIKKGIPVVYADKCNEVSAVIQSVAQVQQTKAVSVSVNDYQIQKNSGNHIDFLVHNEYYKNDCFEVAIPADYQVENCTLALTAVSLLEEMKLLHLDKNMVRQAVYHTQWEGRMEKVLPNVYIDGAHNPEGIEAFLTAAEKICAGRTCCLVFSVVSDKNYKEMIARLCKSNLFQRFVLTQVGGNRQLDKERMEERFREYTFVPVNEFKTISEALTFARKQKEDVIMCAGSLYLVGEIKSLLLHDGRF